MSNMDSAMRPSSVAAGSGCSLPIEPSVHTVELGGALSQQGKGIIALDAALVDTART